MFYYVRGERLEMPTLPGFDQYLDPATSVIVSIDMHEGHLSEDPGAPCPSPRGREIIGAIDEFHAAARALGVPIVHVRSELRPSGIDDIGGIPSAWRLLAEARGESSPLIDEHAIAGTRWTNFVTQVEPGDEIAATKKRLSAFNPSDLDFLLRQMGVRTVVFDGIMTDCCILSSAFDAQNLSYRVVTVGELTRGTDEELERAALDILSLHAGIVVDAEDLTAAWRARS